MPTSPGEWVALNIFLVCLAPLLGVYFGPTGERAFAAWFVFCMAIIASFWSWVIYVAFHFISKYW